MSKLKNVALFAFYDDANKLTKHKPNKDNYVRASVVIQEKETGKPLLMKEWWFDETDINTIYKRTQKLKKEIQI